MFNKFKEKFKEKFKPKNIVIQKAIPVFTTTDGNEHKGIESPWIKTCYLTETIGDFLIKEIIVDGFVKDEVGVMFLLTNVISINWVVTQEKNIVDNLLNYELYYFENNGKELQ